MFDARKNLFNAQLAKLERHRQRERAQEIHLLANAGTSAPINQRAVETKLDIRNDMTHL